MEGLLSAVQLHPGLVVAASSLAFRAVHGLLQALPLPKGVRHDDFRVWKWRNLSVSLVHSLLTGTWAISCLMLRMWICGACLCVRVSVCVDIHVSVCASMCLSVCAFMCLSVCASMCLSVCASMCLSVCASMCLSVCASMCLSVCAFMSVCVGVRLSVCASSVLLWPEMLDNIHSHYTPLSYLLVCISTGYFVQDAGDIILTGNARGSWEFLLHHAMVVWTFLYTLVTRRYVAGAVVALFVEVNSVFLHMRLMLKLAGAQASRLYDLNRLLNLATYVFFRLGAQAFLTWYIVRNYSSLDHAGYFLSTMMLMNLMILIYFGRLLRADFFHQAKAHAAHNGTTNSKKFLSE